QRGLTRNVSRRVILIGSFGAIGASAWGFSSPCACSVSRSASPAKAPASSDRRGAPSGGREEGRRGVEGFGTACPSAGRGVRVSGRFYPVAGADQDRGWSSSGPSTTVRLGSSYGPPRPCPYATGPTPRDRSKRAMAQARDPADDLDLPSSSRAGLVLGVRHQ